MTIPAEWMAAVCGAMAMAIVCLWRDNLKLRALLVKELEARVALCQDIVMRTKKEAR